LAEGHVSRLLEIIKELQAMPEQRRLGAIRELDLSGQILGGNVIELHGLLEQASKPPAMYLLTAMVYRPERDAFLKEVARRLYNFAASAMSHVEHTRRFVRENYGKTGGLRGYDEEVQRRFAKDGVAQVVHGLRNYLVHRAIPVVSSRFTLKRGEQGQHTVSLSCAELLNWRKWNPAARAYLAARERVDLTAFVGEYRQKVEEFEKWLHAELAAIHVNDVAAINAKKAEARVEIGRDMPAHLRQELKIRDELRTEPEGMFLSYMDVATMRRLCAANEEPATRARAFLDEVKGYTELGEDLQTEVVAAFVEYYEEKRREPKA